MADLTSEELEVEEFIDEMGSTKIVIKSTKFKSPFIVEKVRDGNSFFEVITKGKTASPIQGFFTSADTAKREVLKYIRSSKPSRSVRRDTYYEERHGNRLQSKSSDKSEQGSSN